MGSKLNFFTLIALLLCCSISEAAEPYADNKIAANILLQLPKYIVRDSKKPLTLCLQTTDNFLLLTRDLNASKKIYSSIHPLKTTSDIEDCTFLFVDDKLKARKFLRENPGGVLFISNYEHVVNEGGAIAVIESQGQIEIHLNLTAAKKAGAQFSPDLIELSKKVVQ